MLDTKSRYYDITKISVDSSVGLLGLYTTRLRVKNVRPGLPVERSQSPWGVSRGYCAVASLGDFSLAFSFDRKIALNRGFRSR